MIAWIDNTTLIAIGAAVLVAMVVFALLGVALVAGRRRLQGAGGGGQAQARELMDEMHALAERIDRRIDSRLGELQAALGAVDSRIEELRRLGGETTRDAAAPARPLDARQAQVLRLAADGVQNVEIARREGMDVGEVELILNLHRPRQVQTEQGSDGRRSQRPHGG